MRDPETRTLIIAGGGTGGHVLAGIAIADSWRELAGPDADAIFVGARGGIEEKLVPRAGYPLELLKLGSLNRVGWSRRIKTLCQLPLAFLRSIAILIIRRPIAVLGVGGYASGPLVLAARLLGFQTAVLEQNAVPGLTNRVLARFASLVFSAFPAQFAEGKLVVTGNPVRSALRPLGSAARSPFTVFIFGGSQGALGINTLMLEALTHLRGARDRIRIIHQTGEKDYERVSQGYREAKFEARIEKFIYDMPSAYAEASLVICRAGSSTLAEIAAVGRAAIFIPLPTAADNHQEKNARIFVDAGAACLLTQKESRGEDLAKLILGFLDDPSTIDRMEKAVARFYKPNAAQDIVEALLRNRQLKAQNA